MHPQEELKGQLNKKYASYINSGEKKTNVCSIPETLITYSDRPEKIQLHKVKVT